jgi:hypothetical protein
MFLIHLRHFWIIQIKSIQYSSSQSEVYNYLQFIKIEYTVSLTNCSLICPKWPVTLESKLLEYWIWYIVNESKILWLLLQMVLFPTLQSTMQTLFFNVTIFSLLNIKFIVILLKILFFIVAVFKTDLLINFISFRFSVSLWLLQLMNQYGSGVRSLEGLRTPTLWIDVWECESFMNYIE